MSRERDGWEYLDGKARWTPTVNIAMAEILSGVYGDEYNDARRQLDDLVRAAQRDAAEKILASDYGPCCCGEGRKDYADLIFPTYPEHEEDDEGE